MKKWIIFLTLVLAAPGYAQTLSVMSFNVRYPSPNDGPNIWENRRDILVETIRLKDPDLLGTQELFYSQGQYIAEKLPEYTWFGISRRGNHEDEHMGVFYKKSKLKLIDSGNFWLSETPEVPGSMSWDVSLPRMVTWGIFEIVVTGRRFAYYNTHFPHRRQDHQARIECARVIAQRMRTLPPDLPFIITGDFNAQAGEQVYRILVPPLKDDHLQPLARQHGGTPHRLDPVSRQHQGARSPHGHSQPGWPLPLRPLPGLRQTADRVSDPTAGSPHGGPLESPNHTHAGG